MAQTRFAEAERVFEDCDSTDVDILAEIAAVEPCVRALEALSTRSEFLHWKVGYLEARAALSREEVKRIFRDFVDQHEALPPGPARGLRTATIRRLWQKLREFGGVTAESAPPGGAVSHFPFEAEPAAVSDSEAAF